MSGTLTVHRGANSSTIETHEGMTYGEILAMFDTNDIPVDREPEEGEVIVAKVLADGAEVDQQEVIGNVQTVEIVREVDELG